MLQQSLVTMSQPISTKASVALVAAVTTPRNKGSFTNEVITQGGGGGLEMMTSLYFPILFVKNFSQFGDMRGGGNTKFLMRSFVNNPLLAVYSIEYYNICPQRSVVTYGCCNLWNVVAFGYNKLYQKMACSPGFVKYHVNMSRPNAVTDHVSITCIASRN